MSTRYKITAAILAVLIFVLATMSGVFAAHRLLNTALGEEVVVDIIDDIDENVGMFNMLLLGVDEGENRTDTMMLVSVDGYSDRVSVLSIPRDTMITIGGGYQKINAALAFGQYRAENGTVKEPVETVIEEVKALTGLPVNYFMLVDFDGFKDIIEVFDGVDFNVPYNMDYDDPVQNLHIHLKKGPQHLDGQAAHDFVRYRHNNDGSAPGEYVMGDMGRIHWQQQFVLEFLKQKLTPKYLGKSTELFDIICDNVKTNFTLKDLMTKMKFIEELSPENISFYEIPGDTEYIDSLWWFVPDSDKITELVSDVFMPYTREEWEAKKEELAEEKEAENVLNENKDDLKFD